MILSVSFQIEVFITTIVVGFLIGFFYDLLKVFRLLIIHNRIFIDLEDAVFWIVMSILVFFVSLYEADGEIRAYFLIGIFLGIVIYFGLVSKIFMKYSNNAIEYISKYVKNIVGKIKKLILGIIIKVKTNIRNRFLKLINGVKNKLKNRVKKNRVKNNKNK